MLAVSRTASVPGRIMFLIVSIHTMNGILHWTDFQSKAFLKLIDITSKYTVTMSNHCLLEKKCLKACTEI
jgi:hypothetical protein